MEKVASDMLSVNSHNAAYSRVRVDEHTEDCSGENVLYRMKRILSISTATSLPRYFVLYAMLSPRAPEDFGEHLRGDGKIIQVPMKLIRVLITKIRVLANSPYPSSLKHKPNQMNSEQS